MDVLLIQPKDKFSLDPRKYSALPMGLLAIATPLDVAGCHVKILDQRIDQDWEKSLIAALKTGPACIGITSMTGPQIWWGLQASKIIKQHSSAPVVWGGVHPSLLPRQTLENPYIDIVVEGEGEETFFELVSTLTHKRPLNGIKGVWYKENGNIQESPRRPFIDLNRQPPLSYHLVDMNKYLVASAGKGYIAFESSRGCPFNCAFCYNFSFNRRTWRSLNAEQTILRIKRLANDYGVKGLTFRDDNFFVDMKRAGQIMEGLANQEINVEWRKGDIRLDTLSGADDDFLRLIERSRCRSLSIGIESGSQRMSTLLRKRIDLSQALPTNHRLRDYKMKPKYQFLIGVPGESKEDLAESASLMLKLAEGNSAAAIGVHVFTPYPGTELFDVAVQSGFQPPQKLEDWSSMSWSNRRYRYPWLSEENRKLVKMLSFCSLFLARERNLTTGHDISALLSLIARIYSPFARQRVKRLRPEFLIEMKAAEILGYKGY
jgi:anaerobic magnesium-protoporphyrin IX monomethyl ester cyclase